MKKHADILIDLLKGDPTKPINDALEEATFYSLCETSFGIEFESQEESKAFFAPMAELMTAFFEKTSSQNPLIRCDWYYYRTEGGKRYQRAMNELNRQIMGMIEKAKIALDSGETKQVCY